MQTNHMNIVVIRYKWRINESTECILIKYVIDRYTPSEPRRRCIARNGADESIIFSIFYKMLWVNKMIEKIEEERAREWESVSDKVGCQKIEWEMGPQTERVNERKKVNESESIKWINKCDTYSS